MLKLYAIYVYLSRKGLLMSHIHVCLVSGQSIPNLIPLKMEDLAPQRVILLVSPDMEIQADRIEKVMKSWKIEVERYPISPYNLYSARKTCLLDKFKGESITLNVTGGTKIMALAAFEVFREMKKPIIYVDTQNKEIQRLSPQFEKIKFKGVIEVKPYLAAYGQNIIKENADMEIIKKHRPVIHKLVSEISRLEKPVSFMNRYSAPLRNVKTFPLEIEIAENDLTQPAFVELLMLFHKHDIVEKRDRKLIFSNSVDVHFVSGGWLEEYVYSVLSSVSNTDAKIGVTVEWDQHGPRPPTNEYDVIFTCNNQLYLIECKTKRFMGEDRELEGADPIYKLDSLRDAAGGLFGKGMLVSYKKLTDDQKKRLKANKLNYCDHSYLKSFRQKIKEWIK
jgi:hypothetical protein